MSTNAKSLLKLDKSFSFAYLCVIDRMEKGSYFMSA